MRDVFVKRIVAEFFSEKWVSPEILATKFVASDEDGNAVSLGNHTNNTFLNSTGLITPVHYVDLYNTIRYALRHEVLLHETFNAKQVQALRRFFTVLNAYFPFDNENPRRFIKRMAQWFGDSRNGTDAASLHAIMKAGSEGYLPGHQSWIACRGSQKHLRGYPCGLWLLFHVLTVSEYSKPRPDSAVADYHSVLFAMREYVENFFGCQYCATHFGEMSGNLTYQLRHANSSVLWLWSAHNQVNARLAGDSSEDPYHKKVQFPSAEQCPECHKSTDKWDETNVLKFLLNHYHKANLIRKASSSSSSLQISLLLIAAAFTLLSILVR